MISGVDADEGSLGKEKDLQQEVDENVSPTHACHEPE